MCFYSANVTNAESSFKMEQKDAEDAIAKSPQPGTPDPIDPIGMYKRLVWSELVKSDIKYYELYVLYTVGQLKLLEQRSI